MIRKFLFSFLLLTFSFLNFLQAQNMWEEFHLIPDFNVYSSFSFSKNYVWVAIGSGVIRIDTTNLSYQFYNENNLPQLALCNSQPYCGAWTKTVYPLKNGKNLFIQGYGSKTFDGTTLIDSVYPVGFGVGMDEFVFPDSSGTRWYSHSILSYENTSGNSVQTNYIPLIFQGLVYKDTSGCFLATTITSGGDTLKKICSPNNITDVVIPMGWGIFMGVAGSNIDIDYQNNRWYWDYGLNVIKDSAGFQSSITLPQIPNNGLGGNMIHWKENKLIFFIPGTKKIIAFDGANIFQFDSTFFYPTSFIKELKVSSSGRMFLTTEDTSFYDENATNLFTSIDGNNWQAINFNDLLLSAAPTYNNKITSDSLGNYYLFHAKNTVKCEANWNREFFPRNNLLPYNYSASVSAKGTCWIYPIIIGSNKYLFKWNTNGTVDSFIVAGLNSNVNTIVAVNENRCWLMGDSIIETDGVSILHTYLPSMNLVSFYQSWNSNFINDYQFVIGNSLFFLINDGTTHCHLMKAENGILTDISLNANTYFTSYHLFKDLANKIWTSTQTALYSWNGVSFDSIPLPFLCASCSSIYVTPYVFFDNANQLYVLLNDGPTINYASPIYNHLFKYNSGNWNEIQLPSPIFNSSGFFFKDGFFWALNYSESYLRFDPNGFPNTFGNYSVKGKAYHDLNANNIQNTNESGKQNVLIQSSSGDFSFTQYYGNYLLLPDSGQNTITCTPPLYYTVTPATVTVNNTGANPVVDSVDFALQPLPGMNDLSVDVTHYPFITWNTNPGISYWVTVKNPGTTVQSATLSFNVPDTLDIAYVYPTPTSTNGNQLTWSLNNLAIDTTLQFYIAALFQTPTPIGSTLVAIADVQSANTDLTPANNIDSVSYLVTGPYDPNMKLVDPMGEGALGITDSTHHVFTYTIYFQNTGNDTAMNVRVDDFLDADFDWTSFNLISSSSPVDFDLNQNGLLRFHFNTIFLPDSNVNEPMSHGFVKYSLRLKPGPSLGKQLTNAASIYFDYQPPIFTNSTLNTIGMETGIGVVSYNSKSVTLFPNPSDGLVTVLSNGNKMKFIAVYDLSGRLCYTQEAITNQTTINIQSLAQGLYLVKIKLQNGATELKKLVLAESGGKE